MIGDPRDIPGLLVWYSAEAVKGLESGDQMDVWEDLSGNGNHATAVLGGTSRKPLWFTNGVEGKPAVRFTGEGFFVMPPVMGAAASGEIMAMIESDPGGGGGTWWNQANASSMGSHFKWSDGVVYEGWGLNSNRQEFYPSMPVDYHRRYNIYSAPGDWAAYLDGTLQKAYGGGTPAWGAPEMLLGATGPGQSSIIARHRGLMSAVIIYNRKLTAPERADLNTWLAANPGGGKSGTDTRVTLAGVGESSAGLVVPTITLQRARGAGSAEGTASLKPTIVNRGVRANRAHGRQRRASATWMWEPAVEPIPPALAAAQPVDARVVGAAFGPVTMRGTQPVFDVSSADRARTRYRYLISGRDVTYFRGVQIPDPQIELAEPLLWAVASVELPQIAAAFEQIGVAPLRWLHDFAPVEIQRVNVETGAVVATDFRGFIAGFDTRGSTLRLELAGEAHGRAALMNKQPPIFQRTRDLGVRAWQAIDDIGLKLRPRLGPETGHLCERIGGTSYLDHIRELTSRSWGRYERQRSIMPADPSGRIASLRGIYRFDKKDDSTVHGTVFADDALIVAELRRDLAEEPNRIYATGVTPAGMRVRFGSYPGLQHGKAAPYPFTDGRSFGTGTTNAATDTGDGISLLVGRLHMLGYLDLETVPGGYDADVEKAIVAVQRDGDLPTTGRVNTDTWAALYDLDVTGYSLGWAQVQPAAQRSKVRKWRMSATGAVMARNPGYQPSAIRVDRNVDMGTGFTRQQMREWSDAELHDSDAPNWVGTITFSTGIGYLDGDVPVGAGIASSDVRDARSLRPGMNLRLPLFAGGIFVHVAGVNISPDGTVVAAVDTRFRDAAEVWAIIQRNREARRRPGRHLSTPQRSSTITKDSIGVWDEIGGVTDRDETLGSEWTVFPVVAGQEGTIARLRTNVSPPREFVVAVFGQRISPQRLTALVGNPLTRAGSKRWTSESVRDRLERKHGLLYVAGDDDQPCGYWPKAKTARDDDDTADAPLTGRWQDDAGFAYRCPEQPVLWVAMWASGPTKLPAGRIMWPQLEAGV